MGDGDPGRAGNCTPRAPSWCQPCRWYSRAGTCAEANFFRTHDCSRLQVHSRPKTSENTVESPGEERGAASSPSSHPKPVSAISGTECEKRLKPQRSPSERSVSTAAKHRVAVSRNLVRKSLAKASRSKAAPDSSRSGAASASFIVEVQFLFADHWDAIFHRRRIVPLLHGGNHHLVDRRAQAFE